MVILNHIHVALSNVFSRLATLKRPLPSAALILGYGYDIADTQE
jgi:hypothetical protein